MARKRVNTKFLIILTAVVVIGGAGAIAAYKLRAGRRMTPAQFVTTGDKAAAEGKFNEAAANYGAALSLDAQNADLLVKHGDALREATRANPDLAGRERQSWEKALEVDPNHLPALQRLLNDSIETSQIAQMARADTFSQIRDYASKILQLDPADLVAQNALATSSIEDWLFGVQTDPTRIDQSINRLQELMEKDAANADLPYAIARAMI
ncbi:MAG: hypothetical protein ACREIT_09680, partial [Tepidisphaeraceae bacterium]